MHRWWANYYPLSLKETGPFVWIFFFVLTLKEPHLSLRTWKKKSIYFTHIKWIPWCWFVLSGTGDCCEALVKCELCVCTEKLWKKIKGSHAKYCTCIHAGHTLTSSGAVIMHINDWNIKCFKGDPEKTKCGIQKVKQLIQEQMHAKQTLYIYIYYIVLYNNCSIRMF